MTAAVLAVEALHPPGMFLMRAILLPALVLSTVLQPNSWLGRVLEWRALAWVGTISYSIYLWQELFLPEVASVQAHGAFAALQQPPWNVAAILVCACLSRYLLEIPISPFTNQPIPHPTFTPCPITPAISTTRPRLAKQFRRALLRN